MTLTEARRLAALRLRSGWYSAGPTSAYIFCPGCNARVTADRLPWEKPIPSVRAALVKHLHEECPGTEL